MSGGTVKDQFLHVFGDASEDAYGAAAYVITEYTDMTRSSHLVAAKSRVAPLKATSIPRLELMAAVVGVNLVERAGKLLNIPVSKWLLWSDSMDVLHWIRGQSRSFKPFVANRVAEIQTITEPAQWRHIPSQENPADTI